MNTRQRRNPEGGFFAIIGIAALAAAAAVIAVSAVWYLVTR